MAPLPGNGKGFCTARLYNSRFFCRNIITYDYKSYPINFVGSVAVNFRDILTRAANDFGAAVGKVIRYSMPGLIEFHKND